jgi:pyridinium-3,5-biscarboxylic acid mononucleotide synthase
MEEYQLRTLLEQIQSGSMGIDDALSRLKTLPFETVGNFAHLDQHRALRCGFPEVVFGQGKTPDQVVQIARRLAERNERVLVTRVSSEMRTAIGDQLPEAIYHPLARLLIIDRSAEYEKQPGIVVASGGTADMPVAEEAALTAELMGHQVERIYDVGVAGLHRLLSRLELLQSARVVVAVAGMEGALPSVIGGLVSAPVIAVPTSVGYGASFQGLSALLTMLNSCATGISVVNIDNGFGAGYLAALINRIGQKAPCS